VLKGNKKYIAILVICFTALILVQIYSPKPINWMPSYSAKDKIPYGTKALFEALPSLFENKKISSEKYPLYNILKKNVYSKTNYIVINQSFAPDELDTKELLNFVKKGNSFFVAANYFSGLFSDTLKLKTIMSYDYINATDLDSNMLSTLIYNRDSVVINFVNPHLKNKNDYVFKKGIDNIYLKSFDTSKTTILGSSKYGINFINIKWGKGNIYVHTNPEVYTNYHFVDQQNCQYIYKTLSYLPQADVIWDEYYKVSNINKESPFRVLYANESLKTAYYLSLISLLIFMIVGSKRKQRIIPVIEPLQNTTLDFVDVVGTLYFQTGNHKNIATKKITYFLEYIRKNFQIKTTIYDDAFILRVSTLSGIHREKIHELFYYFDDITTKTKVTENELIKLNTLIEEFHTLNKR